MLIPTPKMRPPRFRRKQVELAVYTFKLLSLWTLGCPSKRLLWLPTGPCPAGPPLNVLSHLCSINTLFLSFPRQLPCRGCSTQLRIKTSTLHLLPKSCPSQRLCELSDKNKATDKTGLRREQDEIQKMRKSRDRNRQNTNARRCYYFSPFTGLSSI